MSGHSFLKKTFVNKKRLTLHSRADNFKILAQILFSYVELLTL